MTESVPAESAQARLEALARDVLDSRGQYMLGGKVCHAKKVIIIIIIFNPR